MAKITLTISFFLISLVLTGCDNARRVADIEPEELSSHDFNNDETGWSMKIPEGWKQMAVERAESMLERGGKAMEGAAGEQLDISGVRQILNLQNGRFNILQATLEPYDEEVAGNWDDNGEIVRELISKTYTDQGIKFEMGETRTEVIDGVPFSEYQITLMKPDGSVLLYQRLFGSFRNGYDFGVAISYQEKELGDEIMSAWRASHFSSGK